MKNLLKRLAKSDLIPLGLKAATDAVIQNKMFGSGMATLVILNEEMSDLRKIVKSLEEYCLLIKYFSQIIKNEAKEQKGGFLGMLLGTIDAFFKR